MKGNVLRDILRRNRIQTGEVRDVLELDAVQNVTAIYNSPDVKSSYMEKLVARFGIEMFYPEFAANTLSQTSTYSPTSVNGDGNVVQESVNGNNINGSNDSDIVNSLMAQIKAQNEQINMLLGMLKPNTDI